MALMVTCDCIVSPSQPCVHLKALDIEQEIVRDHTEKLTELAKELIAMANRIYAYLDK